MSENSLSFIAIIAILAVTIVLIRGLKSFFSGGDINEKKKSNKVDVQQKKDEKESIQTSEGDNKLPANAEPKKESSSTIEVNDKSKTDASTGSKEEE